MAGLRTLSPAEITVISIALGGVPPATTPTPGMTPTPTPTPPAVGSCSANDAAAYTPIQRLSRYQFLRTEQSMLTHLSKLFSLKSVNLKILNTLDAREISISHPLSSAFSSVPNDSSISESLYFSRTDQSVSPELIEGYFIALSGLIDYALSPSFLPTANIPCILGTSPSDACVKDYISAFGLKAFRRPLNTDEVAFYFAAFNENGESRTALKAVTLSILLSPYHLMKPELNGTAVAGAPKVLSLNAYELASRLSYTLWDDMPDDALMTAAANGSLLTAAGYQTQVSRLTAINSTSYATPETYNASYSLGNLSKNGAPSLQLSYHLMHREWLNIDRVERGLFNDQVFVRMAMNDTAPGRYAFDLNNVHEQVKEEISEFVYRHFWIDNSNFKNLMTDNRVFTHATKFSTTYQTYLGPLYGITNSIRTDPTTISIKMYPLNDYAGLLTRTALTYTGETHSNPIKRGVFIRRRILCDELPSPNFDALPDRSLASLDSALDITNREKYRVKTSDSACMTCHSQINPLGFAFEDLNAVGFKLPKEYVWGVPGTNFTGRPLRELPIDASVPSLEISSGDNRPANGSIEASQFIGQSAKGNACFVNNVFRFTFGRKEQSEDSCMLKDMEKNMNGQGGSIRSMIQKLATHPQFKLKRIAP